MQKQTMRTEKKENKSKPNKQNTHSNNSSLEALTGREVHLSIQFLNYFPSTPGDSLFV